MSVDIRELTSVEEIAKYDGLILDYLRLVTSELERHYDIRIPVDVPFQETMSNLEKFLPPNGRAFVAEGPSGADGIMFLRKIVGENAEIKRLYIRPEARGTGLGRRMLHHIIDVAREMGAGAVYLDTVKPLEAAIHLYESEGFKHVESYPGSEVASHPVIGPNSVFMKMDLG